MKEYATKDLRRLQQKYINENGSQKRGLLAQGPDRHKHITSDELFEVRNVLQVEPRIGRLVNDRKKANELIAIPRGLLNVLLDELSFLIYCEEHPEEVDKNVGGTADH